MPDPTGRTSHIHDMHRGFSFKPAVRVATTANITLSGTQTIDGVAVIALDRVLVKDQTAGAGNGIYLCAAGAWTRAPDMDQDGTTTVPAEEVMGAIVYVIAGTVNGGTTWKNTNTTAPTLGTTVLTFAQLYTPFVDPMTTRGDIIVRNSSNVSARLAIGAAGKILSSDGTDPSWGNGPMTTAGDLIVGGTSGAPARLAKGADSQVLTVDPTTHLLVWAASASGFANPMTTKGDVIVGDTGGTAIRKAVGTDAQVLTADAASTGGIKWAAAGGGSDLVQTNAGAGSVYIPGLRGSPDAKPASPASGDDEFEALSGWTTLGTLDTSNVSDFPSHWHIERTSSNANEVNGLYKSAPSMPFTVTMRIAGLHSATPVVASVGLMLTDSTPTALFTFSTVFNTGFGGWNDLPTIQWTNRTTRGTVVDHNVSPYLSGRPMPIFLRMKANSSSSIDVSWSMDGFFYISLATGVATNLTVANVGLMIGSTGTAGLARAAIDWIRFS